MIFIKFCSVITVCSLSFYFFFQHDVILRGMVLLRRVTHFFHCISARKLPLLVVLVVSDLLFHQIKFAVISNLNLKPSMRGIFSIFQTKIIFY